MLTCDGQAHEAADRSDERRDEQEELAVVVDSDCGGGVSNFGLLHR